jgi:hypothetical protein
MYAEQGAAAAAVLRTSGHTAHHSLWVAGAAAIMLVQPLC